MAKSESLYPRLYPLGNMRKLFAEIISVTANNKTLKILALVLNAQVRLRHQLDAGVQSGELPKRPKGTDCKSVGSGLQWFESTTPHSSFPPFLKESGL